MRVAAMVVLACALGASAASAQQAYPNGWTSNYVNGVVTATQVDNRNRTVVTITCQPPTGDMTLSDLTFGGAGRRASTVAVKIGNMSINVPARAERQGRADAVAIRLPQSPPILAAVQPTDELSVSIGNNTHSYGPGSGLRMKEVAYACWAGAS